MLYPWQRGVAVVTMMIWMFPTAFVFAQTTTSTTKLDDGFDPNAILSDDDVFDLTAMSKQRLDDFLRARGTLGAVRLRDMDGVEKPAGDIIWRVATSYKLNPKYLLALMQKEQSLVDDPHPTQKQFDWATGYGVCDSCSLTDPSLQEYRGFASQLEWAAKQHREKYLLQILGRGATISGLAPGKAAMIDGRTVVPANQVTAMLYTYTPHIHGNLNLWRIWQRWFALTFPEGTIVRAHESQKLFLIRLGLKRPIESRAVAASMVDAEKILTVNDHDLAVYPDGRPISFPNYALLESPEGKRFLLAGEKKRLIVNRRVFRKLGFNEDEVLDASVDDLAGYEDGPDITATTRYPTGLLVKDAKQRLWYVEDGVKHLIPHRAFLTLYFHGQPAKSFSSTAMNALALGDPYRLHDGELVRTVGDSSVYVIERGVRRPIISAQLFEQLGWQWKNVVPLPTALITTYPIGASVTGAPEAAALADASI